MEQQEIEEVDEIDLKELLFVYLSKKWWIIGATVIGVVIAVLITTLCITPMYESKSTLYVSSKTTSITSLTDLELGTQLTKDYVVLAKSHDVVDQVIDNLDLDMTYDDFLNCITIENEDDTRILTLAVRNSDPYMAKTIVDEYAKVSADELAEIMASDKPYIVDEGIAEKVQVSPSLKKNAVIGGAIGFVLACAIFTILFVMDDSIKNVEDAEKYLGISNLGSVPVYANKNGKKSSKHSKHSKKSTDKK